MSSSFLECLFKSLSAHFFFARMHAGIQAHNLEEKKTKQTNRQTKMHSNKIHEEGKISFQLERRQQQSVHHHVRIQSAVTHGCENEPRVARSWTQGHSIAVTSWQ